MLDPGFGRLPTPRPRRAQPSPPSGRVVRVLTDVAGISREFEYVVPARLEGELAVGTMVRVELHGRRVGGWVTALDVEPTPGVALREIAKVRGHGPSAELVGLARWASWRWAGRLSTFLTAASPEQALRSLPTRRQRPSVVADPSDAVAEALASGCSVLRLPPADDGAGLLAAAAALGDLLVIAPTLERARRAAATLGHLGVRCALHPRDWPLAAAGCSVVGARGAAFAPMPELAAVVVLDEHDEALQNESSPTWHAREVAVERARRAGVPCVLVSPTPSLEALGHGPLVLPSRSSERRGWPVVEVLDRREEDVGRSGLYSVALVERMRAAERLVCVLNRKGRSRLLACGGCGETARCATCEAAVVQQEAGELACLRCGETRPVICPACGSTAFKNLRVGVSRAREELVELLGRQVVEVSATASAASVEVPRAGPVAVVGTEAALHRVGEADLVAFLDFDQELLAPRYRAAEEALHLLVRAARLLGTRESSADGRGGGRDHRGRIVVQTRIPEHEVIRAALHANPAPVSEAESARRLLLRLPPASHVAVLGGEAAPAFLERLRGQPGSEAVEVSGPTDGEWLLRAPTLEALLDPLAAVERTHGRPPGRLRLQVDPTRFRR